MKIDIQAGGIWYHGSNALFTELRAGSTITQWKALAEAFSHNRRCWAMTTTAVFFTMGRKRGIYT